MNSRNLRVVGGAKVSCSHQVRTNCQLALIASQLMHRNAGRLHQHLVRLSSPQQCNTHHAIRHQACKPKVAAAPKSTQTHAVKPTKAAKGPPVPEPDSSSSEESAASSKLSELEDSDEEEQSDEEEFTPNLSADALRNILANEVCLN